MNILSRDIAWKKTYHFLEYNPPVSREIFARFATWFERGTVPNVENVNVVAVNRLAEGFRVTSEQRGEAQRRKSSCLLYGLGLYGAYSRSISRVANRIAIA